MKTKITVLAVLGLLFTLVVPAAQAGAAYGGKYGGYETKCPDGYQLEGSWCVKRTTKTVDAHETVTYKCPYGYAGPNNAGKCVKETKDIFPATPVYDLECPDGFTGPDTADKCVKVDITIETVHVDESSEFVCLDGTTLVDTAAGPTCERTVIAVETTGTVDQTEAVCPAGSVGPDAAGDCEDTVVNTADPVTVTDGLCPDGFAFGLINAGCTRTEESLEYKGIVLTETATCPTLYPFDGADCVRFFDPVSVLTCPEPLVLIDPPLLLSGLGCYTDPIGSDLPVEPIPTPICANGLSGPLDVNGVLVCEERLDPISVTTFVCPDGYSGPDGMNLCSRPVDVTTEVPVIVIETEQCPAGFVGPNADGKCIQVETVTTPAADVTTAACPDTYVGPTAAGDCVRLGSETVSAPAIEVPLFTCPAGYDGPDAKWNCSKEVRDVTTVDPEQVIVGYECPADALGPDGKNKCKGTDTEMVEATKHVTYSCSRDAYGPDRYGKCTITEAHQISAVACKIRLYDYPDGHGELAALNKFGEFNFKNSSHWLNDDVESIYVPQGCTASVSEDYNGGGWCVTLGAGLHNVPDDEMSWISQPGTGCDKPW